MKTVARGKTWRAESATLSPALLKALPKFKDAVREKPLPSESLLFKTLADAPSAPNRQKVDWRDKGVMGVPGDQGGCNACSSFAVVAAVEALHFLKAQQRLKLAPGFIHTCLLGRKCVDLADPMDVLEKASAYGVAYGFPGDYPYPSDQCATTNRYRIAQCSFMKGPNETMAWLASHGPVVADMRIEPSFLHLQRNAVYRFPDGAAGSLHTVCVIGYDQDAEHWIVMNSFGTGWSDGGFGLVAFDSGGLVQSRGAWQIVL